MKWFRMGRPTLSGTEERIAGEVGHIRGARQPFVATAGMVALCLLGWFLASPPWANDLIWNDEGYYGTMARNVLAGPRYVVSPSLTPLGPPGDKPPVYQLLLAASLATFGVNETAVRWPSLVFAGVIALGCAFLAASLAGWSYGALAAALLLTLPWFADASRRAAAEIPLTALGTLALVVAAKERLSPRRAALAGTLLGLAFLCKLWLVVLLAVPVLACIWRPSDPRFARSLLAFLVASMLVGSSHLILVALARPQDLSHWITVYFHVSLSGRLGGAEFSQGWVKPPVFYWSALLHAYALHLPLIVVGLHAAAHRWKEPVARAITLWICGILLLSVFSVKAGIYLYPVVPAFAILAALGANVLAMKTPRIWTLSAVAMVGSFPPLIRQLGGIQLPLSLWAASWLCLGSVLLLGRQTARRRVALTVVMVGSVLALSLVRDAQRLPARYHAPGYGVLARLVAPRVAGLPPRAVTCMGPEAPSLAFYLFRSAACWSTAGVLWTPDRRREIIADTTLKIFVVDSTRSLYGGWPDSTMVAWLETNTTELTSQFRERLGRPSPLRVFVR